ncbi:hypothetical protein CDCA_CDCA01G0061 [Cyanidium caldarium]|uniref:Adenosine 5'-phosphosulfate reductase n=1 Tax=Cyanidium caldarium TaxID=2771 RepID=A0AAV9IPA2_CYACA|nr:hypothetical protein CDCA_CDCA01G0061 [Cyanidium caldarium]
MAAFVAAFSALHTRCSRHSGAIASTTPCARADTRFPGARPVWRRAHDAFSTRFLPRTSITTRARYPQYFRPGSPPLRSALETPASSPTLPSELQKLNDSAEPIDVIDAALARYGTDCAIAFSGAEDVLVIEYAARTGRPFRVFALDTGRLHAETYRFYDRVEKHYHIRIEYCFPESEAVERLVQAKGLFSFYTDGHGECCGIRKVAPLRKKLSTLRAWITGQRRDQSPGTRAAVPLVQMDSTFAGRDGQGTLVKFNPMADVSSKEVWDTIRVLEVPYNELHERGYVSLGCEPCTKPIQPGQHEREGRWWWEEQTKKECGLHAGNLAGRVDVK